MSKGTEFSSVSFLQSLRRASEYISQLDALPSTCEFETILAEELWETVTGESNPPQEVDYTDLPKESRTLIGRYETAEYGFKHPWWLRTFDWEARYGGESLILRDEGLDNFSDNFDRERTVMVQPSVRRDDFDCQSIVDVIDALHTIRQELNKPQTTEEVSFPPLPDELFKIDDGVLQLTADFDEWIAHFFELLPAIGESPTAIYLANTGTSREAAESTLSEELFEAVDTLGILTERSYNTDLINAFNNVLDISTILDSVITGHQEYEELAGLEYQLYCAFLETFDSDDEYVQTVFNRALRSTPPKLDDGETGQFTRVACGAPIIRHRSNRPKLMTVGMYSPNTSGSKGYYSGISRYGDTNQKLQDIKSLFEVQGWGTDG